MARSTLLLLAFAMRPMTLDEVAEGIVVDTSRQAFSTADRLFDIHDVLEICGSLISLGDRLGSDERFDVDSLAPEGIDCKFSAISPPENWQSIPPGARDILLKHLSQARGCFSLESQITRVEAIDNKRKVKLAHLSVKEYIVSKQIKQGPAKYFAVSDVTAHICIAKICLVYLLGFDDQNSLYRAVFRDFPLLSYTPQLD